MKEFAAIPSVALTAKANHSVNVLVVDDRAENRAALKAILSGTAYRILEAGSGTEALRRMLEDEFAVLLIDVVMPEMNGFELAAAIQQREGSAATPIVFMTAQASDLDLVYRGYQAGSVDCLVRPLLPEMVRAKVAVFAELHRHKRRLLAAEQKEQTDIDELKRVQAELAALKATLDAESDAVIIFDPRAQQIVYANPGASLLSGYPTDELVQMQPCDFLTDRSGVDFQALVAPLLEGSQPAILVESKWRRRAASDVDVSLQLIRIRADRVVAIARDITGRKHVEIERELLHREALDAIRVRDEFLSGASHELRTPLSSLQLQIQRLLQPPRGAPARVLSPEQVKARLEASYRSIQRLTRLIGELVVVSRITAGRLRLEREETDLSAIAKDVVARLSDDAQKARCRIELNAADAVIGVWDRARIGQVVGSLLTNAFKFGGGKPIEITVEQSGRMGRLTVVDHGIGIAPENVERIFLRYERAISPLAYGGLGLGLYLARAVVEAHGGVIRVESQPGAGAVFTVDLPREQGPPAKTREKV